MQGNKGPEKHHPAGHFKRIAESVLQFLMRTLTPVDKPHTPACEAPPLAEDERRPERRKQVFSGELFAELLTELPMHRRRLARTHEGGDIDALGNAVHQLLGAVAYCDTPELEEALRELRLAIKTREQHSIDVYQQRAINVLDSTLRYSGYRGHG